MVTLDVPKFLVSFLTFYTIWSALFRININVIRSTEELLKEAFASKVSVEEEESEESEEEE